MANEATATISGIACKQYGLVARWQLIARGLGSGLITRRIERGELLPLPGHRSVYAVGHKALTRSGELMAVTLSARGLLSHGSAAELWGLRGRSRPFEVTRSTKGFIIPGLIVHRSGTLEPADCVRHSRIPVTAIPRTLADCSTRLDLPQLERAVVAAERQKLLDWEEMENFLARRRYGTGALRQVLGRADPRAAETYVGLEELFLSLWTAVPRPEPQLQALVAGFRVDFLWPLARVIVECEGYRYHSGRLRFEADRLREMELRAAGYEVHRASYRILTEKPQQFITAVHRSIVARARESRPAQIVSG